MSDKATPAEIQKPRMLILANRPQDLKSTIAYLNKRDLVVDAANNLNEAIEAIATNQCQFLLMSVEYNGAKVEVLPQLLEQNFNASVIVFAENQDRKTGKRLGNLKAKSIIYSNVSGPSVLAKVKQIQKSNEVADEKKTRTSSSSQVRAAADEQIVIQSGSQKSGDTHVFHGQRGDGAKVDPKEAMAKFFAQLKAEKEKQPAGTNQNTGGQDDADEGVSQSELSKARSSLGQMFGTGDGGDDPGSESGPESNDRDALGSGEEALRKREPRYRRKKNVPLMEYGEMRKAERPAAFATKEHEQIWDSIESALKEVCPSKSSLGFVTGPITEAELLVINSTSFKGSFLVAYSGDESFMASPLMAAEEKLISELRNRGFVILNKEVSVLPMFDFEIQPDLIDSAEMVVTHTCRQFDVMLGFFSTINLVPQFEETAEPMQFVDIGQFVANTEINVDVFIPLPLNNKFIRCWRRGSTIRQEQLNKALNHGKLQLCLKKNQLELFSQYCAFQAITAETARLIQKRAKVNSAA